MSLFACKKVYQIVKIKGIFLSFLQIVFYGMAMSSCSNIPYRGKEVVGADEFVLDSYQIRKGKFSILELEGKKMSSLPPYLLEEYPDTIEEGDVLKVALYNPRRLDLSTCVEEIGHKIGYVVTNGNIELPGLPPIRVANLTIEKARRKMESAYGLEVADTEIFLGYQERKLRKVEMIGLVKNPSISIDGQTRLFDVLCRAQIPTDANLFKSYVVRDGQLLPVDLHQLVVEGDMSQNIVMRGGDKLYIAPPQAATLMVMGEVGKEQLVNLPSGYMPLREALALAGGIPYTGNKRSIQVIRGNVISPKIYTLSWEHVVQLPTQSLLVMPGDIVYVAATPIAQWNRFVTQIFPTLTGIELLRKGVAGVVAVP